MAELIGLTKREFDETMLSVGSHRGKRPLSPVEVAFSCKKAKSAGHEPAEIAAAFGLKGPTMVGRFLKLLGLDPEIFHLVNWGESKFSVVGFSAAIELLQLSKEHQFELGVAICRYSMTKTETRSVRQLVERSGRSLVDCIEDVIRRRPVVVIREIVIGDLHGEELINSLDSLHQEAKDSLLAKALSEAYPEIGDFTSKQGRRRFTVIGGKSVGATIGKDVKFEETVTRNIEKMIEGRNW